MTKEHVNDALVETYRALLTINATAATQPARQSTPGAGVAKTRIVPGKRLRNWHRQSGLIGIPLRAYAQSISRGVDGSIAHRWFANKAA